MLPGVDQAALGGEAAGHRLSIDVDGDLTQRQAVRNDSNHGDLRLQGLELVRRVQLRLFLQRVFPLRHLQARDLRKAFRSFHPLADANERAPRPQPERRHAQNLVGLFEAIGGRFEVVGLIRFDSRVAQRASGGACRVFRLGCGGGGYQEEKAGDGDRASSG